MRSYTFRFLFPVILLLLLSLSPCGRDSPTRPSVPSLITITPSASILTSLGATVRLIASVQDQDGKTLSGVVVTWSSSAAEVATVSASGLVTARGNGAATVTAIYGGVQGQASMTVSSPVPTHIAVTPALVSLTSLGQTAQLTAVVRDQRERPLPGAAATWSSSDVTVATVSASGVVTAVGRGAADITALSGAASGLSRVSVMQRAHSVTLSVSSFSLVTGDTLRIAAEAVDASGHAVADAVFTWMSSDEGVATVNASGVVTAVGGGAATVTATSGGAQAQASVTVSSPVPTHIAVTPALVSLTSLGQTAQLTAVVRDQRERPLPGAAVTWSSSAAEIATVNASGLVTARENGAATVTAVSGGASASSEVTVTIPDRSELAALYHAANGSNWTQDAGWLSNAPLSEWYGVTTDGDGRVIGLDLGDNNLSGAIPSALGGLGSLTHLDLSTNDLSGAIPPELGDLDGLTHLDLSHNPLSGVIPPSLIRLDLQSLRLSGTELCAPLTTEYQTWLQSIADKGAFSYCENPDRDVLIALYHATDGPNWRHNSGWLSDAPLGEWHGVTTDRQGRVTGLTTSKGIGCNKLKNSLPPELGNLSGLRTLNLSCNQLSGPIPAELGNLSRLEHLNLHNNALSGPIPPELGSLEGLRALYLTSNALSGTIPSELGALASLDTLSFYNNNLSGSIPAELGNLSSLTAMYLGANELSGSIPAELGNLSSLIELNLHDNALSGSIPPELGNLSSLSDLFLNQNQLTGPIPPELGNLSSLTDLELAENQLTGPIPPELGKLSRLDGLNLSSNALSGGIPSWLGDLANLLGVFIGGNQLSGSIPPELGNLSRLGYLRLHDNDLSGGLPPELGNLTNLWSLTVSGNRLSGAIPLSLSGLERLSVLHLDDTGLCTLPDAGFETWLEGIEERRVPGPCAYPDREVLIALYHAMGGPGWTNDAGWLSSAPLNAWYGVSTGGGGRVTQLSLEGNELRGPLPSELGALSGLERLNLGDNQLQGPVPPALSSLVGLEHLDLGGNALSGPLPLSLSRLERLSVLHLESTGLCALADAGFQAWLEGIEDRRVSDCGSGEDWDVLIAFYHAMNGANWYRNSGWLIEDPLVPWHGVSTFGKNRVRGLQLPFNRLSGLLPYSLGNLEYLELLVLYDNKILGAVPSSLAVLFRLQRLDLSLNRLTGPVPSELGALSNLRELFLSSNQLSGPVPSELGALSNLRELFLSSNQLSGPVPSELGALANLRELRLDNNRLSGPVPSELGALANLHRLSLHDNRLSGPVPSELGALSNLRHMLLHNNPGLSGPLPLALTDLDLETLRLGGTGLCAPQDPVFQEWLQGIPSQRVSPCANDMETRAYLAQAAQSLDYPVPLVAGEDALLRVFVTTDRQDEVAMPPVRATFFHGGEPVQTLEIPAQDTAVPLEIDEGSLSSSANAHVPAWVVTPGLEMVIEIAPYGAPDFSGGVGARLPESGRTAVDVKDVPPLDLTMVPFLWTEYPDRSILTRTGGLTAEDALFWQTRDLLPVRDFSLTVRDFVWTSADPVLDNGQHIQGETAAVQALDGAGGHYMGVLRDERGGRAELSGTVSVVGLNGIVIAHELGHNMSLLHAPCGVSGGVDPFYPYEGGAIGSWGYNLWDHVSYFLGRDPLVPPDTKELMSYCLFRPWISDYHFGKALRYRYSEEAASPAMAAGPSPSRSLLLWGGVDAGGVLDLAPSFVVDAPPSAPSGGGPYTLTGTGGDGRTLFSLRFEMGMFAEGDGGAFAFVLPAAPSWRNRLARITLSGPEGSVIQDAEGDTAAALLRDALTGQVRGFLRDVPISPSGVVSARRSLPEPGLEMVISRGVPDPSAW